MDKEWPENQRAAFLEVAARQDGLKGIHDFRTRRSGSLDFAQFHMEVARGPDRASGARHRRTRRAALERDISKVEVLIHLDPEGHVDTDNPAGRGGRDAALVWKADMIRSGFGKRL